MSYAEIVLAIVPAAPPTRKNQRATSCPAPISAKTPYLLGSRFTSSAFWWVFGASLRAGTEFGRTFGREFSPLLLFMILISPCYDCWLRRRLIRHRFLIVKI